MRTSSAVVDDYARLLSLAVHEFRTPASVVGGYLRMLQTFSDPPLDEKQTKMVQEAEKSCARIVSLIGELSEVAKLDAGTAALADESFDVFHLAGEVAESVQEARDRGVQVEGRGEAIGASMRGDVGRFRTAFSACFRAIAREQPQPGVVVVERKRVSESGRTSALIVVTDENTVQLAYDAAPGAFDEKRGGLGLALPIARRVIERQGGRIWTPAGVAAPALVIELALVE